MQVQGSHGEGAWCMVHDARQWFEIGRDRLGDGRRANWLVGYCGRGEIAIDPGCSWSKYVC